MAECSSARTAATSVRSSRSTSRTAGSVDRKASDQLGVVARRVLGGAGLGARGGRGRVGDLPVELVADVAHGADQRLVLGAELGPQDRKTTRLNSSNASISY